MRGQTPTPTELDQHLHFEDERITDLKNQQDKNFDKLESDRNDRKIVSDTRYQDLANRLHSIEHDVTFIYGGGIIGTSIVTILLTLNVIKVTKAEQKIGTYPDKLRRTDNVDLVQAIMYRDGLSDLIMKELEKRDK